MRQLAAEAGDTDWYDEFLTLNWFKFDRTYTVKNGWARFEASGEGISKSPEEGADGIDFQLMVDSSIRTLASLCTATAALIITFAIL